MRVCPALPTGTDMSTSVASSLGSFDCQLDTAVGVAYGRFFGHGGMFTVALTMTLTIYVAILALRLLTGHTQLTLQGLTPRIFGIGLVLTFATAWPAYQAVVFDLLARGPEQIATALLGGSGGATHAFAQRLDQLFDRFIDLAQALESKGQAGQAAARWVWASTLLLMLCTAGLVLVVKIVLAVLLALGPLFIVFALFDSTRGLFQGWLKTVTAFALAPLLIVIGGVAAITIMAPITDGLLEDPAALAIDMKPVFMLFMGTVIYAIALVTLFWTALSLTRHWRLPFGQTAVDRGDRVSSSTLPSSASLATLTTRSSAPNGQSDGRVESMLVAVTRSAAPATAATRVVAVEATHSRAGVGASSARATGLGQTQRPPSQRRGFSQRIKA